MKKEYVFMKSFDMPEAFATSKMLKQFILEAKAPSEFKVKFVKEPLKDIDIQRIVDEHSSDNGTFFFNGIQYEFNEILEIMKKNWYYIRMFVEWRER